MSDDGNDSNNPMIVKATYLQSVAWISTPIICQGVPMTADERNIITVNIHGKCFFHNLGSRAPLSVYPS